MKTRNYSQRNQKPAKQHIKLSENVKASRVDVVKVEDRQLRESSPFGPQSLWSSLLGQRELLQLEIRRGNQLLQQWRKQQDDAMMAWLQQATGTGAPPVHGVRGPAVSVDKFLSRWVNQLQQTLTTIAGQIEIQTPADTSARADESVFELLRGAR